MSFASQLLSVYIPSKEIPSLIIITIIMADDRPCLRMEITGDDGLPYALYYDPDDYRPWSPDIHGNVRTPPLRIPIVASPEQMSDLDEPDDEEQLDTEDEEDEDKDDNDVNEDNGKVEADDDVNCSKPTTPLPKYLVKRIKITYGVKLGEGMSTEDDWRETAKGTYSLFRNPRSAVTTRNDPGQSQSYEPSLEHIEEFRMDESVAKSDNGPSMDLIEEFNMLGHGLKRKRDRSETLREELERYKREGDEPWPELRYTYSKPVLLCHSKSLASDSKTQNLSFPS